jgi:hypothetical protein
MTRELDNLRKAFYDRDSVGIKTEEKIAEKHFDLWKAIHELLNPPDPYEDYLDSVPFSVAKNKGEQ